MSRSKLSLTLVLAIFGFVLVSTPGTIRACSCPVVEPDAAYQKAFRIFTGTVKEVTVLTRSINQDGKTLPVSDGRMTHFAVAEYFKGTGGTEIELHGGNTSCDINFQVGKQYLVYASQENTGTLGHSRAVGPYHLVITPSPTSAICDVPHRASARPCSMASSSEGPGSLNLGSRNH